MTNKQADWPSVLGNSALVGAGTFAVGALGQELSQQREAKKRKEREELPANSLVVDVPRHADKKAEEEFMKGATDFLNKALAVSVGLPAGFLGTKAVYDSWKKKQMDDKIEEANNKYLTTLHQASKTAESTPLVDAFCTGLSAELGIEKSAGALGGIKSLLSSGLQRAKAVSGPNKALLALLGLGGAGLAHDAMAKNVEPNTLSQIGSSLGDSWKTVAALTALLGGGAMIHANMNKNTKAAPRLPSAVALNYEDDPAAQPVPAPEPQLMSPAEEPQV